MKMWFNVVIVLVVFELFFWENVVSWSESATPEYARYEPSVKGNDAKPRNA